MTLIIIGCSKETDFKQQKNLGANQFAKSKDIDNISFDQQSNQQSTQQPIFDCGLDWGLSYHNDDNDACRNVNIVVSGLTGDCKNCDITEYSITLNHNDVLTKLNNQTGEQESIGIVEIGTYKFKPSASFYTFNVVYYSGEYPLLYTAISEYPDGLFGLPYLGRGEITNLNYYVGYADNVSICIDYEVNCDGIISNYQVCDTVNFLCW